jgi:hypothetical protein
MSGWFWEYDSVKSASSSILSRHYSLITIKVIITAHAVLSLAPPYSIITHQH